MVAAAAGFQRWGRAVCAAFLLFSGCAQMRQGPATTPDRYGAPALEEGAFVSFDGARLGMQAWLPDGEPKAVIAAIHGMSDYSEAFAQAGPYWAAEGYAVHAFDQRGFGRSPGRGVWPDQDTMLADIAYFVAALRARYPGRPVILAGHSMGGAAALAALGSSTPPDADALVLIAPAVWGWSQMNLVYAMALRVAAGIAPGWELTGESLGRWPTDNMDVLRKMSADPLMLPATRVDALYGLVDLMQAGWEAAPPADLPTLILLGDNDQVVPPGVIRRFARERAPGACFKTYRYGYHMLTRDLQREAVLRDVADFIETRDCPPPEPATAAQAGAEGTKDSARR